MTCSFCQTEMILLRSLQNSIWVCPASDCGATLPAGGPGDTYQARYIKATKYTLKLAEKSFEEAAEYAQQKGNPVLAEGIRQMALRCKLVYSEERRNKWFKQVMGE